MISTLALLLCSHVAIAQQQEPVPSSSSVAHLAVQPLPWPSQNRFLEISGGRNRQDYRETDTLALTGTSSFDTETGNQNVVGIALRWQTISGLLLHMQTQRQSGATDYNGYVQAGSGELAPYKAITGNTATQFSLNVGYAFNPGKWGSSIENLQLTPLMHWGRHHWQRNLVQYSETYDFNAYGVGALLQWQTRAGTVLEAQALFGGTRNASVSAPTLDFAAKQSGGSYRELQLGISQDFGNITGYEAFTGWRVAVRHIASDYNHGTSPVVNGLQAPPNQHSPKTWALALQKQF